MRNEKWPNGKTPSRGNFTQIPLILFEKLKDHKNPVKIRPTVNKRSRQTNDLEVYLKNIIIKSYYCHQRFQ